MCKPKVGRFFETRCTCTSTAVFLVITVSQSPRPSFSFSACSSRESLWMSGTNHDCEPDAFPVTNSVTDVKQTQIADSNQCPGFIPYDQYQTPDGRGVGPSLTPVP